MASLDTSKAPTGSHKGSRDSAAGPQGSAPAHYGVRIAHREHYAAGASVFDLASEIRFMHWTTGYFVPVQNQAVLTVSVTFPARRK